MYKCTVACAKGYITTIVNSEKLDHDSDCLVMPLTRVYACVKAVETISSGSQVDFCNP